MNRPVMPFIGFLLLPMGCVFGDSTGPDFASLDISPTTATLTAIGDTVRFTAVARDSEGNEIRANLFWAVSSAEREIATVNSNGLVTAVGNGTTSIQALTGGFLSRSGFATLTVAVP